MAKSAPGTRRITISLPAELEDRVREVAWSKRVTVSAIVRDMIECAMKVTETPDVPAAQAPGADRRPRFT